jgi:hypothetical protein
MKCSSFRVLISFALKLLFLLCIVVSGYSQSVQTAQTVQTVLQQVLLAHVSGTPVRDVMAIGTITNANGSVQAVTISAKGTSAIRMDFPVEKRSVFYSGQQGWTTNSAGKTVRLEPHAALRRPTLFPFLDLITEVANPQLQIVDGGTQTLNGHNVRRLILSLPDPTPNIRLFKIPLDEALDVYIDTQSYLVMRSIRYRTTDENVNLKIPSVLDFSDYRSVSGAQTPFKIVNTIGTTHTGINISTLVFQSVTINTGLTDSFFAPQ